MGRSLNYTPNATIKSRQSFVGSISTPINNIYPVSITTVDRSKAVLYGATNGYGSNMAFYRMLYFDGASTVRCYARNSGGGGSSSQFRYTFEVVEYE